MELPDRNFKIILTDTLKGLVGKGGLLASTDGTFGRDLATINVIKSNGNAGNKP